MSLIVAILIVVLLGAVVLVVSAPLRSARRRQQPGTPLSSPLSRPPSGEPAALEHDELEAARAAKYREIRDAELDYRTGKLSREDYEAIDRELRAEAIELLNRLERVQGADDGAREDAQQARPASSDTPEPPSPRTSAG